MIPLRRAISYLEGLENLALEALAPKKVDFAWTLRHLSKESFVQHMSVWMLCDDLDSGGRKITNAPCDAVRARRPDHVGSEANALHATNHGDALGEH